VPKCEVCGKEWTIEDARQGKSGGRVEGVLLCFDCSRKLFAIEFEYINACLQELIKAQLGQAARMPDMDKHIQKHYKFLSKLVEKGIPLEIIKYRMLSRIVRQMGK